MKLVIICVCTLILSVLGLVVIFGDIDEKIFIRKLKVGDKFVSPGSKNPFILDKDKNILTILEIKDGYVCYHFEWGYTDSCKLGKFYYIYIKLLKYKKIKK